MNSSNKRRNSLCSINGSVRLSEK